VPTPRTRRRTADPRANQRHIRRYRMGRFALGFLVAIILVIFIVVQCAQALF
jgi:hypothetical protein